MALRTIVTLPEPVLRRKARPVTKFDDKLQKLIDEYGVIGMTSNPSIFEKAMAEGSAYDDAILETHDLPVNEAFDRMSIEDIQHAADLLRPVFDRTNGRDGLDGDGGDAFAGRRRAVMRAAQDRTIALPFCYDRRA